MRTTIVVLFAICAALPAFADDRVSPQTNNLIDTAKRCDDLSAEKYSRIREETADTVATASFDSCNGEWSNVAKYYYNDIKPQYDATAAVKNPFYLSVYFKALNLTPSEKQIVDDFRDSEIRRIRVIVLDLRLKAQ